MSKLFDYALFDPSVIWNYIPYFIPLIVGWLVARSQVGEKLSEGLNSLLTTKDKALTERDIEITQLKLELKSTTSELRQAREYQDEDRLLIRTLRGKCNIYVREINQHRMGKGQSPILAGDDE
jgi:hypothetical protein